MRSFILLLLVFLVLFIASKQQSYELRRGKYLVVGNCVNCLPRNIKQIVKQFDGTVILFNNNKNFEKLNTNMIVLCNSVRKRKLLPTKLTENRPLVFVDTPHDNDPWTCRLFNGVYLFLYCLIHNKLVRFMTTTTLDARSSIPTTGFMVVMHLVSNGSDVYFTGFDPNDKSIHGKNDTLRHDFHTERTVLNELVNNNIITELGDPKEDSHVQDRRNLRV